MVPATAPVVATPMAALTAGRRLAVAGWLALGCAAGAVAATGATTGDTTDTDPPAFKLTLGRYQLRTAGGGPATDGSDINLRWRQADRTLWLGVYRDGQFGRQWRAGWDDHWNLPGLAADVAALLQPQLLPSLQLASGGFVGGSLALQAGGPVFVQVGMGRTNLRPYANLNFDPNDALTLAVGWQGDGERQLTLSAIADDRLHTGQQHHHLTLRWPLAPGWRVSADLLHKQCLGDDGPVRAWGQSLGLDGPRWFARLAHDPHQNFSAQDAWRLSGGLRF